MMKENEANERKVARGGGWQVVPGAGGTDDLHCGRGPGQKNSTRMEVPGPVAWSAWVARAWAAATASLNFPLCRCCVKPPERTHVRAASAPVPILQSTLEQR